MTLAQRSAARISISDRTAQKARALTYDVNRQGGFLRDEKRELAS
jgi:hypothetical protein